MGGNTDKVPNPYKAAVTSAKQQATPHAREFQGLLDTAESAMEAGAWISTDNAASGFGLGLSAQRRTLNHLDEDVSDAFQDVIGSEPDEVDPDAWQTRWHNV